MKVQAWLVMMLWLLMLLASAQLKAGVGQVAVWTEVLVADAAVADAAVEQLVTAAPAA